MPPRAVIATLVELTGFGPTETLLACWDNSREAVRTSHGELRWQCGPASAALRTEAGSLSVYSDPASVVLPKRFYYPAWLMVRSLEDVADWADVERISQTADDEVVLVGDGSSAVVARLPALGLNERVTGFRPLPWTLRLIDYQEFFDRPELVDPTDLTLGALF